MKQEEEEEEMTTKMTDKTRELGQPAPTCSHHSRGVRFCKAWERFYFDQVITRMTPARRLRLTGQRWLRA